MSGGHLGRARRQLGDYAGARAAGPSRRTVKGGKRQAEAALRAALVAVDRGEHDRAVPTHRSASYVAERIQAWHAAGRISGRTRESYEVAAKRLAPIGDIQCSGSAAPTWSAGISDCAT